MRTTSIEANMRRVVVVSINDVSYPNNQIHTNLFAKWFRTCSYLFGSVRSILHRHTETQIEMMVRWDTTESAQQQHP